MADAIEPDHGAAPRTNGGIARRFFNALKPALDGTEALWRAYGGVATSAMSHGARMYASFEGMAEASEFELLTGRPLEAALAKSCLIAIDVQRDEHGIAATDTRHPDVLSERPWRSEAGEPSRYPRNPLSA